MSQETTKLKCPNCGKALYVSTASLQGINPQKATITCIACKQKSRVSAFSVIQEAPAQDKTEYDTQTGYQADRKTLYKEERQFEDAGSHHHVIGTLRLPSGKVVQLRPGEQVVGRLSPEPPFPDIKIPDSSKRMSRQHLVIKVVGDANQGYKHTARLFKKRVNPTDIGGDQLGVDDEIVLQHGDVLRLPGADLIFEQEGGTRRSAENTILNF